METTPMKNKLVKGFTLALFISLIIGFVTYRSGFLGGEKSNYPVSPNGSPLNNQTDSIPYKDTLIRKLIPSSKVIILKDESSKEKKERNPYLDSLLKNKSLISGSKSAIMIKPEDLVTSIQDSIAKDTLNKQ